MRPRRARDEGHKRKFLVVVDDTPECMLALSYAARRAAHTSGAVVLLFVIEPEAPQGFAGVEDIMRAEAREQAQSDAGEVRRARRATSPTSTRKW